MAKKQKKQPIVYEMMNDINTFHCSDGEVYFRGKNSMGEEFILTFCSYNFLCWVDKDTLEHIKDKTIKHIKEL
jgi:hypothetical protein